jgi:DNA-binding beta-propeller fold protein YncE
MARPQTARFWATCGILCVGIASVAPLSLTRGRAAAAEPRLTGFVPLPQDTICLMPAAAAQSAQPQAPVRFDPGPLRMIRDPYPSLSAVAVDMARDEVIAADENLLQILVYDRNANTPPTAALTEPRRLLGGSNTKIEFVCGLYADQSTGDVYGINNDTETTMVVFSRDQRGNVAPARALKTPQGTYGIAVDEETRELFLTIQHDSAVVVFPKHASGNAPPTRRLQGDRTELADPHGIAIDKRGDVIFVTNHGSASRRSTEGVDLQTALPHPNWPFGRDLAVRGSGRFRPPSITVYPRSAAGDVAPTRTISGPRTRLNMPSGIVFDERRGEILVANDMDDAILVFRADASGDTAPIRVLAGNRTGIKNPTGLFLDTKHDELWVANFGGNGLTVHPATADGNVPPRRVIRSRPLGTSALMIGNPGALAYDTKRGQILVPN